MKEKIFEIFELKIKSCAKERNYEKEYKLKQNNNTEKKYQNDKKK